jgi:small-conductance mechanosensitive channel
MLDAIGNTLSYTLAQIVLPLAVTVAVTLLALRLVTVVSGHVERRFVASVDDLDRRARLGTVYRAGRSTAQVAILAIATLIGLATVGINIGPALTAAGILGLAVSLGAQTLIKDFIGGLTVLLEDEYRVGDTVRIGTVTGEVERISLRRTDLRDAEGRLFIVPNGDVRVVTAASSRCPRARGCGSATRRGRPCRSAPSRVISSGVGDHRVLGPGLPGLRARARARPCRSRSTTSNCPRGAGGSGGRPS